MKKSYVKPQVYFENFQLSASIAAGCAPGTGITHSQDVCGFKFGQLTIFLEGVSGCPDGVPDDGKTGYCYHNPTDTLAKLFASA